MMPEYTVARAECSRDGSSWRAQAPHAPFLSLCRYAFLTFATFGAITIWQ